MSLRRWSRTMFALADASARASNLMAREIADALVPEIVRKLERQPPLVPNVVDEWRKYRRP